MDMEGWWEDAPRFHVGGLPMRYKVGAEQLQQVPLVHRPRHRQGESSRPGRPGPCGLHRDRPDAVTGHHRE